MCLLHDGMDSGACICHACTRGQPKSRGAIPASAIFWAALTATFFASCAILPAAFAIEAEDRPVATAGCIGQSFETCIDSVKRFIAVNADARAPDFSPDIQGKIPATARANFDSANLFDPQAIGQLTYSFFAVFGRNERIKSISVSIHNGFVAHARTEADYEATGIYQAVAGVAKGQCAMSEADFYKLFDASRRGKTSYYTEFDTGHYTTKDLIGEAKPIFASGLHVKFSTHAMEGADLVSETNLSGTDVSTWLDLR
jgi:hypothetical protein